MSLFERISVATSLACLGGAFLACGSSAGTNAPAPAPDAPTGGPTINVTTLAPSPTWAPGEKANATWAAYSLDDGEWRLVFPAAVGAYQFPVPKARWALALVCSNEDDTFSKVFVHRRTAAITTFEATLEEQCTPPVVPAAQTLTGTLSNVPMTTAWLDFGYARDSRGVALPVTNSSVPYEMVGIAPGTWDFAFGLRDDPSGVLTRVVLRRGEVVTADKTIDIDVSGLESFAPTTRPLVVRGLDPADTVTPKIYYAAGGPPEGRAGPDGVDFGPQSVPVDQPEAVLAYSTVPEGAQVAGDRYHGVLTLERDRRADRRVIDLVFHQSLDLDVTFPPPLADPSVVFLPPAASSPPTARLETKIPVVANAARYEVLALFMPNRRTEHAWFATFDAAVVSGNADVVDTTPDLSAVPGWRAAWGVPVDAPITVTVTTFETSSTLGDGAMQRSAAKTLTTPWP